MSYSTCLDGYAPLRMESGGERTFADVPGPIPQRSQQSGVDAYSWVHAYLITIGSSLDQWQCRHLGPSAPTSPQMIEPTCMSGVSKNVE